MILVFLRPSPQEAGWGIPMEGSGMWGPHWGIQQWTFGILFGMEVHLMQTAKKGGGALIPGCVQGTTGHDIQCSVLVDKVGIDQKLGLNAWRLFPV